MSSKTRSSLDALINVVNNFLNVPMTSISTTGLLVLTFFPEGLRRGSVGDLAEKSLGNQFDVLQV